MVVGIYFEWNGTISSCDLCVFSHFISSTLLTHEHMSVSSQFVNVNCECDFVNKKKDLFGIYMPHDKSILTTQI
jgi:hypothetical protein